MATPKRVLVMGATGTVGSEVLRELLERGATPRALVRTRRALPAGVETALGDLLDRASIEAALEGVDGAIVVAPHSQQEAQIADNVLAACTAKKVRFTYFTVGLPGTTLFARRFWRYAMGPFFPHYIPRFKTAERLFAHESRPLIVGAGAFCQVTDYFIDDIVAGTFTEPGGRMKCNRVHAADIGATLAIVTLQPPPGEQVFNVEGPEAVSGPEAAAIWAAELGTPVAYAGGRNTLWRDSLRRKLSGEKLSDYLRTVKLLAYAPVPVSKARLAATTKLLGRAPRTYRDYVREKVQQLRASEQLKRSAS